MAAGKAQEKVLFQRNTKQSTFFFPLKKVKKREKAALEYLTICTVTHFKKTNSHVLNHCSYAKQTNWDALEVLCRIPARTISHMRQFPAADL